MSLLLHVDWAPECAWDCDSAPFVVVNTLVLSAQRVTQFDNKCSRRWLQCHRKVALQSVFDSFENKSQSSCLAKASPCSVGGLLLVFQSTGTFPAFTEAGHHTWQWLQWGASAPSSLQKSLRSRSRRPWKWSQLGLFGTDHSIEYREPIFAVSFRESEDSLASRDWRARQLAPARHCHWVRFCCLSRSIMMISMACFFCWLVGLITVLTHRFNI